MLPSWRVVTQAPTLSDTSQSAHSSFIGLHPSPAPAAVPPCPQAVRIPIPYIPDCPGASAPGERHAAPGAYTAAETPAFPARWPWAASGGHHSSDPLPEGNPGAPYVRESGGYDRCPASTAPGYDCGIFATPGNG